MSLDSCKQGKQSNSYRIYDKKHILTFEFLFYCIKSIRVALSCRVVAVKILYRKITCIKIRPNLKKKIHVIFKWTKAL